MPHKIYGQYIAYMFQTPTTQVWKRLYPKRKRAKGSRLSAVSGKASTREEGAGEERDRKPTAARLPRNCNF